MSDTFLIGMNAKAFYGAESAALSALTELTNVKDVSLSLESGEADVTTRANSGWRATASTLRECNAEFEMLWKPGDAGFQALKDAFLGGTNVRMAFLTGAMAGEDSEGPVGDFSITKFSRNEPLEEGVTVPVTAKLAVWDKWLEPPIIADGQALTVPAASVNSTVVGDVVASQGDDMSDEAEVFSITSQTVAGVFAIDAADGEVTIADNTSLGAEGTVHTLTVKVAHTTSGLPYATADVTVTVSAAA